MKTPMKYMMLVVGMASISSGIILSTETYLSLGNQ